MERWPAARASCILLLVLLVRALVGLQPHSGQDNHHGSKVAYGGDFEAQRHWMELTVHLPPGQWYWYDLEYWGLDYPPLTGYHSWLCGIFSQFLVGDQSVALMESRGLEDPIHKAFMRISVVFSDVLVFFTAVDVISRRKAPTTTHRWWMIIFALLQPAIIVIDHGHFQYNTVALGFSLWAFYYVTKADGFVNCMVGSIFFCLALNFKQMTLYYAPAIFFYLLGRCARDMQHFVQRFLYLGLTVITTFAILWGPVVFVHRPDGVSALQQMGQVVQRLFPFQRGLFEDKVANLWCALSTKPFSIRDRIPSDIQPLLAIIATFCLMLPGCVKMFQVGRRKVKDGQDFDSLLLGAANSALAFFLASFQVHEKSIMIPLAPLSLLVLDHWQLHVFCVTASWSLYPLLVTDRLETTYWCLMCIYGLAVWLCPFPQKPISSIWRWFVCFLSLVMLSLHVMSVVYPPPDGLPDLYPLLWSLIGCCMVSLSWLISTIRLVLQT